SLHQTVISDLDSFPALVSIHGVVPAHNRRQRAILQFRGLVQDLLYEANATGGQGVSAIGEEVDEGLWDSVFFSAFQQSHQMTDVGMNSAIADTAQKMDSSATLCFRTVAGINEINVLRNGLEEGNWDRFRKPTILVSSCSLTFLSTSILMRTMSWYRTRPAPMFR